MATEGQIPQLFTYWTFAIPAGFAPGKIPNPDEMTLVDFFSSQVPHWIAPRLPSATDPGEISFLNLQCEYGAVIYDVRLTRAPYNETWHQFIVPHGRGVVPGIRGPVLVISKIPDPNWELFAAALADAAEAAGRVRHVPRETVEPPVPPPPGYHVKAYGNEERDDWLDQPQSINQPNESWDGRRLSIDELD